MIVSNRIAPFNERGIGKAPEIIRADAMAKHHAMDAVYDALRGVLEGRVQAGSRGSSPGTSAVLDTHDLVRIDVTDATQIPWREYVTVQRDMPGGEFFDGEALCEMVEMPVLVKGRLIASYRVEARD